MFGFLIIHGDHVALASPVGLFDVKYLALTRHTARQLRPPVANSDAWFDLPELFRMLGPGDLTSHHPRPQGRVATSQDRRNPTSERYRNSEFRNYVGAVEKSIARTSALRRGGLGSILIGVAVTTS
jgi:hypothetical protein